VTVATGVTYAAPRSLTVVAGDLLVTSW